MRRAVSTGTHIYSPKPLRQRLEEEFGDLLIEDLPVRFQVCAAHIERAAEHWFDSGPLVDAVVASAAVPGLLPPAEVAGEHYLDGGIVNSIPVARAVQLGATRLFVLQVGPDRPAAHACPAGRGRSRGSRSRSLAGTGSCARWPSCPPHVEAHVLPARGTTAQDDSLLGHRDFCGVEAADRGDVRREPRLPGRLHGQLWAVTTVLRAVRRALIARRGRGAHGAAVGRRCRPG